MAKNELQDLLASTDNLLSRRDMLFSAGAIGVAGMLAGNDSYAGGHSGGKRVVMTPEEQAALEQANETLVNNFIRDYSTRDVDVLAEYMHDDIIYQVSERQGEVHGVAEYKKRNAAMFAGLEKVDWRILRSHAIGQVVINDRIDDFFPYPGSKIPRMSFRVTGYFLIIDNKIKVWRDFGFPGAEQLIEPAPKA